MVYYPRQFHALRAKLYALSLFLSFRVVNGKCTKTKIETRILAINLLSNLSLSRRETWATGGGKSGATFARSLDERYVLKFVKHHEFNRSVDNSHSCHEGVRIKKPFHVDEFAGIGFRVNHLYFGRSVLHMFTRNLNLFKLTIKKHLELNGSPS